MTRTSSYTLKFYQPPSPHLLSQGRWNYKKIGLLGGTFNPPHHGHMHIARAALRLYKFHAVWWMVSPQNPLKAQSDNFNQRFVMTEKFLRHNRMIPCAIEKQMRISYSFQTIQQLKKRFPRSNFVWIAGMDNAKNFHRWQGWKKLISMIPFAFFNRPPHAMALRQFPLRTFRGKKLTSFHITGKTLNISSTQLRKEGFAWPFKSKI